MVQYQVELDQTFAALADPTRRSILERLGEGNATISQLAEPLGMSLTGAKKHVQILQDAGLLSTEKVGRARFCSLGPRGLEDVQQWIEMYRQMLDGRLDRLGELLQDTKSGTGACMDTEAEAVRGRKQHNKQAHNKGESQ